MTTHVICFELEGLYQRWKETGCPAGDASVFNLDELTVAWSAQDKEEFLMAYIDAVGQLSACNHSLLWWATDLSSKNRFLSPLAEPLEKFFKIMRLAKRSDKKVLIFFGVPCQIEGSLRKNLTGLGIQFSWEGRGASFCLCCIGGFVRRSARILRHMTGAFLRIILTRWLLKSIAARPADKKKSVYVIKTFVSSRSFDETGTYRDLYFGSLVDFIEAKSPTVILADIIEDFSRALSLIRRFGKGRIYPLEMFLNAGDVFKASFQILFYMPKCPGRVGFCGFDISDLVSCVFRSGGGKIQPPHLYQYAVMRRFLKYFMVHTLVFPYEANPWEKICLWALKEFSPGTKTAGYQHTIIPQASANLFTSKFEEQLIPRPDVVLSVGNKPRDIIHRYETCVSSRIEVSCGLRFEYLLNQPLYAREKRKNVLLVLEGLPQIVDMTNYALNEMDTENDLSLRVRAHPMLPLEQFSGRLKKNPYRMSNVQISKETSLKEDLSWADIVVYWGSVVALEAAAMGKPVIHYDTGSLLSFDPLFELNDFKWTVNKLIRLPEVVREIYALPEKTFEEKYRVAREYINAYFHRVDEEAMKRFLI